MGAAASWGTEESGLGQIPTKSFTSIHRPPCGDRPDLLDAVATHADIPVVEIDGRVAVAGDQSDLVAEPEPIGGGRDGEPAVLVRGALIGRRGLVANQRRGGIGPSASVGSRPTAAVPIDP